MKSAMKTLFGSLVALPLALSPTGAFAEEAANSNTQIMTSAESAFSTFNDTGRSIDFVEEGAAAASANKIAIVVWSGNRELQREAYQAALRLRDEGIPLALILGPSLDPTNSSASIQVYARSVPVFEGTGSVIGINNVDTIQPETMRLARIAYSESFPTMIASLALGRD